MILRKRLIAALLACATVFLFACSQATEPQVGEPETTEKNEGRMVEEVIKKPGGDLFIVMPAEIESFHPLEADNEGLINLLSLIYETPLKYDVNGRLLPCLFESYEVSEDKTSFTFSVRADVYFSDGTPLKAEDIVYSAKQAIEKAGSSTGQQGPIQEDEENENSNVNTSTHQEEGASTHASRFKQLGQYVANITASDEHTVVVQSTKPGNMILHFMTFPVFNEQLIQEFLPVGTGVYKVDDYQEGEEMTLVRNDYWWQDPPYIDKIVALASESYLEELEFVEASIIDFATTDVLYAGKYHQPDKTQVIDYMTNYYDCLVPNLLVSELQDVNVRQAISYALDRREILSTVLLNHGVPTNLPIAPDFFAYDSRYKISDFDSSMAKKLLEESGYITEEDGQGRKLKLKLIVLDERNGAYKKEAAKAIKKQLADLYIEIEIEELEMDEYMERLEGGQFDLAYCSFYLDSMPSLSFMFDHNGSGNYGYVQNDEISAAIGNCQLAITEDELTQSYGELQKVLTERVPQIGLYFRMHSIICDESIQGISGIRQNMLFATVSEWYNTFFSETIQKDITEVETPEEHEEHMQEEQQAAELEQPDASETPFGESTEQPAEQTQPGYIDTPALH